ncbi:MAG: hypothetical protein PHY56_07305 [Candidatus Omnitrophica bacterium]|nr:hypothetical protein [Candidatus Omnitrophota bacterium]
MKKIILLLCVLAVFLSCAYVFAGTIYFNNGRKVKGTVVAQEGDKVIVQIGEGDDAAQVTFFSDEIKRIGMEEEEKVAQEPAQKVPAEVPVEVPSQSVAQDKEEVLSLAEEPKDVPTEAPQPEKETVAEIKPAAEVKPATEVQSKVEVEPKVEVKPLTETKLVAPMQPKVEPQPQSVETKPQPPAPVPQPQATEEAVQDDAVSKEQETLEELTLLLDDSEREYFTKINLIAKDVINKTMQILANPESLTQDVAQLPKMMQDLSSDISGIITQLNAVQAPVAFAGCHKEYIGNLNLLKDMLTDMASGNISASQEKINDLQAANMKIQQELSRILTEKKSKPQTKTIDASD